MPAQENRKFYRTMTNNLAGTVYCIRFVRYGILCQPAQFRRQHIGRFIDAGIACSTHHHSHNRRDVQRYPVLFQRRQYGLRGNQSTDHLESPASYGHSPDHYGTHTLAGTCLGRDSTYPVHLRSILFTEIADQYFRPVYGIALSSLCRCNQRNRCRSTTTDRLRNSICPHRHRLDNEFSGPMVYGIISIKNQVKIINPNRHEQNRSEPCRFLLWRLPCTEKHISIYPRKSSCGIYRARRVREINILTAFQSNE